MRDLIDDWNANFPPGTEVVLTNDSGEQERTRTRSEAWEVCGQPVVSVEGRSGGYLLTRLKPAPTAPKEPSDA